MDYGLDILEIIVRGIVGLAIATLGLAGFVIAYSAWGFEIVPALLLAFPVALGLVLFAILISLGFGGLITLCMYIGKKISGHTR